MKEETVHTDDDQWDMNSYQVKKIGSLSLEFQWEKVVERKPELPYNIVATDKQVQCRCNTGAAQVLSTWWLPKVNNCVICGKTSCVL